jgi:hypothetical protein
MAFREIARVDAVSVDGEKSFAHAPPAADVVESGEAAAGEIDGDATRLQRVREGQAADDVVAATTAEHEHPLHTLQLSFDLRVQHARSIGRQEAAVAF